MAACRVCCILDMDGFRIRKAVSPGVFREEFVVRELAWVRVSPEHFFASNSRHFDLRPFQVDGPGVEKTVHFQRCRITGLSFYPEPDEDVLDYDHRWELVRRLHARCRRTGSSTPADVVAYKGGSCERDFLNALGIPSLDLEAMGCPTFEQLRQRNPAKYKYISCGRHDPGETLHCPRAEVAAFRDWLQRYQSFRWPR